MKKTQFTKTGVVVLVMSAVILLPACSSFSLQQVDYGWPVESVLTVKDDNTVSEGRYAIAFNVAPLAEQEFLNPNALKGKEIRLIRGTEGMYYVTGAGFKFVYVMMPRERELSLHTKYEVSETGLKKPALNLREPYVELLDGTELRLLMTSDDIYKEADLRAEGRK